MLFSKSLVLFALSFWGISIASSLDLVERSTVNGACTGAGGAPGVCISTSSCSDDGGSYISNACPGTPDNIKCCTKPSCGNGGNCRWTSQCSTGNLESGLCPGPTDFECCLPAGSPKNTLPEKILAKAKTAAGTPYVPNAGSCSGPTTSSGHSTKGFDCSGLVSWAVCQVTGRSLFAENLRNTHDMYCASESKLKYKKIAFADRKAGDAVFFGPNNCDCANFKDVHHVGLMLGSGTTMWNALKSGTNVREDNFGGWSGYDAHCPYVIRFS